MGKWAKGQSGNPRGRPPGSHDFRTLLEAGDEQRIAKAIVERALNGEPVALRIAADRLWPALSRREISAADGSVSAEVARAEEIARDLSNDQLETLLQVLNRHREASGPVTQGTSSSPAAL